MTDAGWVQMTGPYAFAGSDPTGLLLHVEATTATTATRPMDLLRGE